MLFLKNKFWTYNEKGSKYFYVRVIFLKGVSCVPLKVFFLYCMCPSALQTETDTYYMQKHSVGPDEVMSCKTAAILFSQMNQNVQEWTWLKKKKKRHLFI